MAVLNLPYLHVYRARGRLLAYYRRGDTRIRLTAPGGARLDCTDTAAVTRAWQARHDAWEDAERAAKVAADARAVRPQSIRDLIARYRASVEFSRLRPATRRDYEKGLAPLDADYGNLPAVGVRPHHVTRIRDRYATRTGADGATVDNVRQANRVVTVLSILMSFARGTLGWIADNPALRPRRLQGASKGYTAWTRAQFDQFMGSGAVPEPLRRAAALGWYTGQRKADCLSMTRSARAGGMLEIIPGKTARSSRARRHIPEHPSLTEILDAAPQSDSVTLLTRADGQPWKVDHFNHAFAAAVKAAGLPAGLSFHGIRKGLMTELAEAGASDAELDAVVPHSDPRVRASYRASADQRRLAKRAIGRIGGGPDQEQSG